MFLWTAPAPIDPDRPDRVNDRLILNGTLPERDHRPRCGPVSSLPGPPMSMTATLMLLAASVALGLFAGWRGALPPDLKRGVRMVPWRFVMLVSGAVALLAVIHLGALFGAPVR